jgi:hypothetical protein
VSLDLGTLVARISADTSGLQQGVSQAQSSLRGVGKMAKAAAAAAAAGMVTAGKAAMDYADNVQTAADETGESTTAYQKNSYALQRLGLDSQSSRRALGRLNQRMGLATQGNKQYSEAFQQLGVHLKDSQGHMRSTNAVLDDTFDAISKIPNPTKRAAVASKIFGTHLSRMMLPALKEGSKGLDQARQHAKSLGLVLSKDDIDAVNDFGDQVDDMQKAVHMAFIKVGAAVDELPGPLGSAAAAVVGLGSSAASAAQHFAPLLTSLVLIRSRGVTAGGMIAGLKAKLASLRGAAAGSSGALAGLGRKLAVGGALAGALVGVGLLIHAVTQAHQKAAEATRRHEQTVKTLADALHQSNGAMTENVRRTVVQSLEQDKYAQSLQHVGVSLKDMTDTVIAGNPAFDRRLTALKKEKAQLAEKIKQNPHVTGGLDLYTHKEHGAADATFKQYGRVVQQIKGWKQLRGTMEGARRKQQQETQAVQGSHQPMSQLELDMEKVTSDTAKQADKTKALTDAINILNSKFLNAKQSEIQVNNQVRALSKSLKQNGLSFADDTKKGDANTSALIGAAKAAQNHMQKVYQQTHSLDAATSSFDADSAKAYDNMIQMGLTKDEAQRLIDKYFQVPGNVNTRIGTPGMAASVRRIENFQDLIERTTGKSISLSVAATLSDATHTLYSALTGHAAGGAVSGPGTGTSDSVPMLGSNGEHVWTAREVHAAGGHRAVEHMRASALRGYAQGGPVGGDGARLPTFAAGGPIEVHTRAAANMGGIVPAFTQWAGHKLAPMFQAMLYGPPGSTGHWGAVVAAALRLNGDSLANMHRTLRQIQIESGGNQYAQNNWDVNAARGTPSKGLLQTIGPTFRAYHVPGTSWNIFNPLANVAAGVNYADSRYGSIANIWPTRGGYDQGGWLPTGLSLAYNGTGRPERVTAPGQSTLSDADARRIGKALAAELEPMRPLSFTLNNPTEASVGEFADEIMFAVRHESKAAR